MFTLYNIGRSGISVGCNGITSLQILFPIHTGSWLASWWSISHPNEADLCLLPPQHSFWSRMGGVQGGKRYLREGRKPEHSLKSGEGGLRTHQVLATGLYTPNAGFCTDTQTHRHTHTRIKICFNWPQSTFPCPTHYFQEHGLK